MLDKFSSQRLSAVRFPLIVGVVFIHAYPPALEFINGHFVGNGRTTVFLINLISQAFARLSVPSFFLMSGFLFFLSFKHFPIDYFAKILSRAKSLLLPLVFWNLIALLFFFVLQSVPGLLKYFSSSNTKIFEYSAVDVVRAVFGIGREPIAYQFWFIRDLIVLVIFSPLLLLLLRSRLLSAGALVGFALLWLFNYGIVYSPSNEALLFFYLGGFLCVNRLGLFFLDRKVFFLFIVYVVVAILDAGSVFGQFYELVHKIGIIIGVALVFSSTSLLNFDAGLGKKLLQLAPASFFVFAAHEPVLSVIRKIVYRIIPVESGLLVVLAYLIIPCVLIWVLVMFYRFSIVRAPVFVTAITGGR